MRIGTVPLFATISLGLPLSSSCTANEEVMHSPAETEEIAEADPKSIQKGKENYAMFCLACHGPEDTSIDSPSNLFDEKWYHGSSRSGVEATISNGIMEKGMPGWGQMIPQEDITSLVDYLLSFQKPVPSPDE